ncbi:MAG: hypothetical protein U9N73_13440 [Candidatus Auribacterota bacterium]|nr:hypothetical protein [Candidatus Auribacterota bacterium]
MQRLKIDPKAIDLLITAIVLERQGKLQHAGHYAFLSIGRVLSKSLEDEEGPTTPTNFSWRMDQLVRENDFPKDWRKKIGILWGKIRDYLYQKVSTIPSYRARHIASFVEIVKYTMEQAAGINFEDLLDTMTLEDRERLSLQFGDSLAPEENFNI